MDMLAIIEKCVIRHDGCIGWDGASDGKGYPHFTRKVGERKRTFRVFRALYEMTRGPIPEGYLLHHECRRKWCVNPFHCRPVRKFEHDTAIHPRATKTHCKYGHEFSGTNLIVWADGHRKCRTCLAERRSRPEYKAQMHAAYLRRKAERNA